MHFITNELSLANFYGNKEKGRAWLIAMRRDDIAAQHDDIVINRDDIVARRDKGKTQRDDIVSRRNKGWVPRDGVVAHRDDEWRYYASLGTTQGRLCNRAHHAAFYGRMMFLNNLFYKF